ncbi:MAG: hypothetical protein WBB28_14455, partial [Crinalium sp.]
MATQSSLLDQSVLLAEDLLKAFAESADFTDILTKAFGSLFDQKEAEVIRQQWISDDFSDLPVIELLSSSILGRANGGYAASNNTIYLSQDYLGANANLPQAIANVLLEEIGHYVDSRLNSFDAAGDEGEIFSALVQGKILGEQQLQLLRTEDDSATITIDGQNIGIEQSESLHNIYDILSKSKELGVYSDSLSVGQQITPEVTQGKKITYTVDKIISLGGFYAVGLTSNDGEAPVLLIRGTDPANFLVDFFDNATPEGIGVVQYNTAVIEVENWLKKAASTSQKSPAIVGHSLGGALAQLIAAGFTQKGGYLGEIVTFSSPGINNSNNHPDASDFVPTRAGNVTHYISDGDFVSLAGEKYLPGQVYLMKFSSQSFKDRHNRQVINKPNVTSQLLSVDDLSSSSFHYTDPDYFAFLLNISKVSIVGPALAAALFFRGTTEALRLGTGIVSEALLQAASLPVVTNAVNAATTFTIDIWNNTIASWSESDWGNAAQFNSNFWETIYNGNIELLKGAVKWTADILIEASNWTTNFFSASVSGTNNADGIAGDTRDNALIGLAGNDTLSGLDGNDILYGGDGNDTLYGGAGDDIIDPGWGDDLVDGGSGTDVLKLDYSASGYIYYQNLDA